MTWCLRNEVLVTGCGRGFGLGGGVSRVLPEAGRIPRGHWRAGQGAGPRQQRQFSGQSYGVTPSSEPLSELGRSVPQMKRWGRNSPTQTSHSCICSQMGTTEEADWSLASEASSQPLEGAA